MFLDKTVCYCSTMNRIDLPHLVWALEELVAGRVVNQITVDPDTAHYAKVALDRMLALPGADSATDGVLITIRSALGTQKCRITHQCHTRRCDRVLFRHRGLCCPKRRDTRAVSTWPHPG